MANGVELATAYVSLTVDGSQVNQGVRRGLSSVPAQADRIGTASGRKMGDRMSKGIVSSVGKIAGPLAAIFATVGIGKFISGTVDEAREAQKVSAITDSIVKSTGGVAKVTAKHVGDLSNAISKKIGVDDEAIQASANLLLTFKKVRNEVGKNNDVFDQAVGLAQDLSKAGFGSAESTAKQLGKALQDPVKGMTALGRAGVQFTDEQKKQVKDAIKHNDLLKAQKIILGEVQSQVGGVAESAATSGEKVGVAFANLKEKIGQALLPALDKVSNWFLDKGLPAIEKFGSKVKGTFTGLSDLLIKGDFTKAVKDAFGWDEDSPEVQGLLGIRDAALDAWDAVKKFGGWVKDDLLPALEKGRAEIFPALKKAIDDVSKALSGEGNGVDWKAIGTFITETFIPALAQLVKFELPQIVNGIKAVIVVVESLWAAFQFFLDVVRNVGNVALTVFSSMSSAMATMLDALSNVPGFGWAKDAADKLRTAASQADALKSAIEGIPESKRIAIALELTSNKAYQDFRAGERDQYGLVPKKKREFGGPVRKGQPYIVGERRPELFVPDSNGKILPRVPGAAGAVAGAGGDFDYHRMSAAFEAGARRVNLAVDTRQNAIETTRYQNRTQL